MFFDTWSGLGRVVVVGMLTLGTGACATSPHRAPIEASKPARDEEASPKPREEIPRESLTRLSSAVEGLSQGSPGAQHAGIVAGLRHLADAIELLPNERRPSVPGVREAAQRLADSDAGTDSNASEAKKGLRAALQALVTRPGPEGHQLEYQRAVRALGESVEGIDGDGSLHEQQASIASAFRAATDTVFIAAGGEAPFGEAEAGKPDTSGVASLEDAVDAARAEVLSLAQTDWTQTRQATARTLVALANVVAAADRREVLGHQVSDIRFQAERIRYADTLTFGRAAWIKAGLSAALDALEELRLMADQRLSVWVRAARRAVASIEERDSLSFQRAAVQDAFRATLDAFVVATQAAPACR